MSRPKVSREEKLIPVGTALPPKLLDELERKALEFNISLSALVRNILLSSLDIESSSSLILDVSPELKAALVRRAKKLETSLHDTVRRMLQGILVLAEHAEERMQEHV
jgi:hypothetical protein